MSAAYRVAVLAVALATAPAIAGRPAHAQGFFDSLFGFGGSSQPRPSLQRSPDYRTPARPPPSASGQMPAPAVQSGGKYRTLCVRMCDGYYFPISGSVTRSSFYRDAQICRRSCGSEATLFYHPAASGDASQMVDLTGRAYARLPIAFRYRKTLVDGCKCRPEAWSESELARHRRYAAETAAGDQTGRSNPDPVVASMPEAPESAPPEPLPSEPGEPGSDTPLARPDPNDQIGPATAPPPRLREPDRTWATPAPAARHKAKDAPSPSAPAVRATARPRPQPAGQTGGSPGLFGLGFGGSSQPKLRWPGD
jgi:hypothetical protein